jgi:hypothetical protein
MLLRTLDEYAELFNEHHHAEDNYFFPALRVAEPGLGLIVDQLTEQHEQLAAQLAVVVERGSYGRWCATTGARVIASCSRSAAAWQLRRRADPPSPRRGPAVVEVGRGDSRLDP